MSSLNQLRRIRKYQSSQDAHIPDSEQIMHKSQSQGTGGMMDSSDGRHESGLGSLSGGAINNSQQALKSGVSLQLQKNEERPRDTMARKDVSLNDLKRADDRQKDSNEPFTQFLGEGGKDYAASAEALGLAHADAQQLMSGATLNNNSASYLQPLNTKNNKLSDESAFNSQSLILQQHQFRGSGQLLAQADVSGAITGSKAPGGTSSEFFDNDDLSSPRTSKLLAVARDAAARDQAQSQQSMMGSRSAGFGEASGDLPAEDGSMRQMQQPLGRPLDEDDSDFMGISNVRSIGDLNQLGSLDRRRGVLDDDAANRNRQQRYIAMGEREDDESHGGCEVDLGQIDVQLQDDLDDDDVNMDERARESQLNSSPDLRLGDGDDDEDEIDAMERLMRNKMDLAKQLVYQQQKLGFEGEHIEEVSDLKREHTSSSELFKIPDQSLMFPSSAELEPVPAAGGTKGAQRSNQDRRQNELVGFGEFTDMQTNEVNLNDLNRRVDDLKSELIDDGAAEVVVDQLVTDSDFHASRFGGEEDDDDIGASQQEQIQQVLRELLDQGDMSQLAQVHLQGLKEGPERAAALDALAVAFAEREDVSLSPKLRGGRTSDVDGHVDVRDMKQESNSVLAGAGEIANESMSPPLVTSNLGTPKMPTGQALKPEGAPAGGSQRPPMSEEPVPVAAKQAAAVDSAGDENDSFHRLYNKEIKVNQDEIPLLLMELTDIAYKFIKKDQYEKAYVLLQKTESVLEVVNLEHSKRDRYFAYITYHNMAMCFQKLGMLEECIIYLKETIQVLERPNFFKDTSIALRMRQSHMLCQLKLQLCAILSQTQKHSEAMDNAKYSVRLAHQILRDMYDLCVFYSNKIKFKDDFSSLSLLLMDENAASGSNTDGKDTKLDLNAKLMQKNFIRENSPVRDIPYNLLEESISMIERTALKILPIMKELGNRLAGTKGKKGLQAFHTVTGSAEADLADSAEKKKEKLRDEIAKKLKSKDRGMLLASEEEEGKEEGSALDPSGQRSDIQEASIEVKNEQEQLPRKLTDKSNDKSVSKGIAPEDQVDMRTILGFLNQNEWILNLNIGNIMQIQPVRMRDCMQMSRNEQQLARESFLEKLQLLIVSYFCVSTEMRFIIQSRSGFMKDDIRKEKELEQEYWHVKALDIACAFLPSECPLFNHILLSYQKHHDPSMQPIDEDAEQEDEIRVLRPLKGIENSKYQPLIREIRANTSASKIQIDVPDVPMSPLSKCFDQRLLPKRIKTSSINMQTDPIEKPKPPVMHSQSIGVQDDLKEQLGLVSSQRGIATNPYGSVQQSAPAQQDSETMTEAAGAFDEQNAYMLSQSASKYQDSLITKIVDDPRIGDKQKFITMLISRMGSQDPEKFAAGVAHGQFSGMLQTYANTQSQNLDSHSKIYESVHEDHGVAHFAFDPNDQYSSHRKQFAAGTLSVDKPMGGSGRISSERGADAFGDVYGSAGLRHALANKGKITQSGQIKYNVPDVRKRGSLLRHKQELQGVEREDFHSFDQKSQPASSSHAMQQHHVRSLYADRSSNDAATTMALAKHQITSQSLAPSMSMLSADQQPVATKKKHAKESKSKSKGHKKNASISGGVMGPHGVAAANSHHEFLTSANINIQPAHAGGQSQQLLKGTGGVYKQTRGLDKEGRSTTMMYQHQGSGALESHLRHYARSGFNDDVAHDGAMDETLEHKATIEASMTSLLHQRRPDAPKSSQLVYDNSVHSVQAMRKKQKQSSDGLHLKDNHKRHGQSAQGQYQTNFKNTAEKPAGSTKRAGHGQRKDRATDLSGGFSNINLSNQKNQIAAQKKRQKVLQSGMGIANERDSLAVTRSAQVDAANKESSADEFDLHLQTDGKKESDKSHSKVRRATNYQKYQRQLVKLQQQQTYLNQMKRQIRAKTPAQGLGKKKSKILSRKKYGSDRSSNSPQNLSQLPQDLLDRTAAETHVGTAPHLSAPGAGGHLYPQAHGYSIGQQAGVSIFDHSQAHSLSKISYSQQQQLAQNGSKASIEAALQDSLLQVAPGTHLNGLSAYDRPNVNTVQASTTNLLGNVGGRSHAAGMYADQRFLGTGGAIEDVGDSMMTGEPISEIMGGPRTDSKQRNRPQAHGVYKEHSHGVVLGHPLMNSDAPTRVLTNCVNSTATLNAQTGKNANTTISHPTALQIQNQHSATLNKSKNKSEDILAKLQNLLGNKESRRYTNNHVKQPRSKSKSGERGPSGGSLPHQPLRVNSQQSRHNATVALLPANSSSALRMRDRSGGAAGGRRGKTNGGSNKQRKSTNSIEDSQGRSGILLSRYSQNSKFSRSRVSRSRSSAKSGDKSASKKSFPSKSRSAGKSKSVSNERRSQKNRELDQSRRMSRRQLKLQNQIAEEFAMIQNQLLMSQSQLDHHNALNSGAELSGEHTQPRKKSRQSRGVHGAANRPKSSLLPENKRDSFAPPMATNARGSVAVMQPQSKRRNARKLPPSSKEQQAAHNSSIENLQRQVIENQKILHHMAAQQQQKTTSKGGKGANLAHGSSTNALFGGAGGSLARKQNFHNHNNSISQMNGLGSIHGNASTLMGPISNAKGSKINNLMAGSTILTNQHMSRVLAAEMTAGPGQISSHIDAAGKSQQISGSKLGAQSQATQNLNLLQKSFLSSGTSGTKRKSTLKGAATSGIGGAPASTGSNKLQQSGMMDTATPGATEGGFSRLQGHHMLHSYKSHGNSKTGAKNLQVRNDSKVKTQKYTTSKQGKISGVPTGVPNSGHNLAALHAISTTTGTTNHTNTATASGMNFLSGKTSKQRKYAGASQQQNNSQVAGNAYKKKRRSSIQNSQSHIAQGLNRANQQTHQQMMTADQLFNFEQIQQQLESGLTLGGVDLQAQHPGSLTDQQLLLEEQLNGSLLLHQQASGGNDNSLLSHHAFVPHRNLMPKTTGSQAHLLPAGGPDAGSVNNGNLAGLQAKNNFSLNQTGRLSAQQKQIVKKK